jgi:hypothetical protein
MYGDRRRLFIAGLLAFCTLSPTFAVAQFPFLGGKDYKLYKDQAGRFQLEYPKDWQPILGVGDVLVTFAQKKGEATLLVKRFQLLDELGEINDGFGQLEVDGLKMDQPQATDVSFKVVGANGRSAVVIDYSRPGLAGPERGRQYSFPIGQAVYRLNCTALAGVFAKYDPQFLHIAQSFMAASAASTPSPAPAAKPPQTK